MDAFSASLNDLRIALEKQPDIVLAYLFGSRARRQDNPLSDVDIAVLLAGQPDNDACFARRLEIMGMAMDTLRVNEVDIAILNQTPLALRYRVVRDGRLIFGSNEQARVAFEAKTVMEYLDFKPVIELFERAVLEKAQKGELLNGYNPHRGAIERYRRRRKSPEGTPASHLR